MLSGAYVPAYKLMDDNGYKIDWDNYFPGIASLLRDLEGRDAVDARSTPRPPCSTGTRTPSPRSARPKRPKTWEEVGDDMKALKDAGYDCPMAIDITANESWQLMEQFSAIHNQPIATKNNGYDGLDAELTFNKTKFVQNVTDLKNWYDAGPRRDQVQGRRRGHASRAFAAGHCQMT